MRLCDYLRCPSCYGGISKKYFCDSCKITYKEENNIINLLNNNFSEQNLREYKRLSNLKQIVNPPEFQVRSTVINFRDNILSQILTKKPVILEIGSGFIAVSRMIKKKIPNSVIFTCDLSKERLKDIEIYNKHGKIDFKILASIENLPFKDNCFDYVIGSAILHHTKNMNIFVKEISRVIKRKGIYFGIDEPYGNFFFRKIQEIRFKGYNEFPKKLEDYNITFKKNKFDISIKFVEKIQHQRPSAKLLRYYYLFYHSLPLLIKKRLGGNIIIKAEKQ